MHKKAKSEKINISAKKGQNVFISFEELQKISMIFIEGLLIMKKIPALFEIPIEL